jgi:ketosteroid isomerase-like protein
MDAKDVVLRQHDAVWCRGDLSAVDELFAADFVGRHFPKAMGVTVPEGLLARADKVIE